MRLAAAIFAMTVYAACHAQAAGPALDYHQIISCNVAVEDHYRSLAMASIKQHDGREADIGREETNVRRKWISLAVASGKSLGKGPDEIQSDLVTKRKRTTADGNQAEWKRLDELYANSDPSLKLMPYYKPLSAKEREDIRQKRDGITKAAKQKNEVLYQQCSTELR